MSMTVSVLLKQERQQPLLQGTPHFLRLQLSLTWFSSLGGALACSLPGCDAVVQLLTL